MSQSSLHLLQKQELGYKTKQNKTAVLELENSTCRMVTNISWSDFKTVEKTKGNSISKSMNFEELFQ